MEAMNSVNRADKGDSEDWDTTFNDKISREKVYGVLWKEPLFAFTSPEHFPDKHVYNESESPIRNAHLMVDSG